jgi:predicted ATPase
VSEHLLVGANNAGKSTIVEALRLLSLVANRPGLQAGEVPSWLGDTAAAPSGVSPSTAGMDLDLGAATFHGYTDPPARIIGAFTSGAKIDFFVGADAAVFAVMRDRKGAPVRTPKQREAAGISRIAAQPQVGPVQRQELLRDAAYIRRAVDSSLAPLHFQNQVYLLQEYWEPFRAAAESTWPGLQLYCPEVVDDFDDSRHVDITRVRMLVRDGPFTGELSSMGHGLQMWLQMLWFLARSRNATTVVLDEPDVYMHADLQRRLIRFLSAGASRPQLIVATHSVEMMAEVEPSDVVIVDATRARSRAARDTADLQKAISDLGGVHTLQYARLWSSRRCLLVEGKDTDVLSPMYNLLYPTLDPLDAAARFSIGGWAGWGYGVGIARFVREGDREVMVYSILDSDYWWPEQLADRRASATKHDIGLHIWTRKEIENYLLDPALIHRIIARRRKGNDVTVDDVTTVLEEQAETLRDVVIKGYLDCHPDRALSASSKLDEATNYVSNNWTSLEAKLAVVPGKRLLRMTSKWSQDRFRVPFGVGTLVKEMQSDEIPREIRAVLDAIKLRAPMPV